MADDEGIWILLVPSGEQVVGYWDGAAWRRWLTGEQVFPTHFKVLPFADFWDGSYDTECPDLVKLREAFPDMAALLQWATATRQ